MEDQVTNRIAKKVKTVLEAMTDTVNGQEEVIFEKVTIGRQDKIGQYKKATAEVMIDDEDNFLYTFQKHHKSRDTIVMISIFVKGLTETAELKKLNIKDLVITELEDNPTFDASAITSQILTAQNGVRVEGMGKSAKMYSAARIITKIKLSNPPGNI